VYARSWQNFRPDHRQFRVKLLAEHCPAALSVPEEIEGLKAGGRAGPLKKAAAGAILIELYGNRLRSN
jgi:hypothetical protein